MDQLLSNLSQLLFLSLNYNITVVFPHLPCDLEMVWGKPRSFTSSSCFRTAPITFAHSSHGRIFQAQPYLLLFLLSPPKTCLALTFQPLQTPTVM